MQFGLHLPHLGRSASREVLSGFAQAAEATGFDSLWVSDHVIVPKRLESRYPYNESGEFPFRPDAPFLDPIATLLFVAGCTERVRLGTAVLIIPYRNPVVQAKELATLDFVSGGRLILGIGTGWMAEEFAALDVPFAHRGGRTNEYLALIKQLWSAEDTSFSGTFYRLDDVGFAPKPLQQPRPPIWGGGHSEPAFRRGGQLCDGWLGANVSPQQVAAQFARVQHYAREAGRDPDALTLAARIPLRFAPGNEQALREEVAAYRAAGVSHLAFDMGVRSVETARETMERVMESVLAQARG
ncbi:MAG TPA: LLM class F420-dependent oxidoreductase [Dehalococcoidia bacterium]|nr:LLM class F420-dependent oxidoreductase [Dehalococcoidia bacterium]